MTQDHRILRYLAGTSDAQERLEVERLAATDQAFAAELQTLRDAWSVAAAHSDYAPDRKAALWDRIAADTVHRTDAPATAKPQLVRTSGPRPRVGGWRDAGVSRWIQVAAAILFVVGGAATYGIVRARNAAEAARVAAEGAELREVATRGAQRADVFLPDGSRVTLAPMSKIKFARAFGSGAPRDVQLEGQAFFDVVHDSTRPFAVHTATGIARDIGTRFSVDATKPMEVIVEEGIVAIGDTMLNANDVGRVTSTGAVQTERNLSASEIAARLAWTEGKLVFRNARLSDALSTIARWYDRDVVAADSALARYPITLTLTSERFEDAVEVLTRALEARAAQRIVGPDTLTVLTRRTR